MLKYYSVALLNGKTKKSRTISLLVLYLKHYKKILKIKSFIITLPISALSGLVSLGNKVYLLFKFIQ